MTEQRKTHEAEGPPGAGARAWEDFLDGAGVGPEPGRAGQRPPLPDLSQLVLLVDALLRVVPPELRQQLNALQREVLLTIRALIDWYLERLERGPAAPRVEDIPIE